MRERSSQCHERSLNSPTQPACLSLACWTDHWSVAWLHLHRSWALGTAPAVACRRLCLKQRRSGRAAVELRGSKDSGQGGAKQSRASERATHTSCRAGKKGRISEQGVEWSDDERMACAAAAADDEDIFSNHPLFKWSRLLLLLCCVLCADWLAAVG